MKESCTRYEGVRESDCLRPVKVCQVCRGHGEAVVERGDRYGGTCWACNGTGGDRCANHPREEEA